MLERAEGERARYTAPEHKCVACLLLWFACVLSVCVLL